MPDNKLTSLNPNPLLATYGAPETMPNLGAGVQSLVDSVRGYGRDAASVASEGGFTDPHFWAQALMGLPPEVIDQQFANLFENAPKGTSVQNMLVGTARGAADLGDTLLNVLDYPAEQLEGKFGTLGGPSVAEARQNRDVATQDYEGQFGKDVGAGSMRLFASLGLTAPVLGALSRTPNGQAFLARLQGLGAGGRIAGNAVAGIEGNLENALLSSGGHGASLGDQLSGALLNPMNVFNPAMSRMTGYHGTPHTFDRFSLDHMGTGEGAQAYGWGLYFAENPEVAAGYYRQLADSPGPKRVRLGSLVFGEHNNFDYSSRASENNLENIRASLAEDLLINENSLHAAGEKGFQKIVLDNLDQRIERYKTEWPEGVKDAQLLRKMLARPGAVKIEFHPTTGGVYKADLPEDDELLHWDKPLSKQPEKVRKALEQAGLSVNKKKLGEFDDTLLKALQTDEHVELPKQPDNPTGEEIYNRLSIGRAGDPAIYGMGHKAASQYLASLGIPGLKYLDAGSRSEGKGTHNYVIWDEDRIKHLGHAGDPAPVPEPVVPAAVPDPVPPMAPAVPVLSPDALTLPKPDDNAIGPMHVVDVLKEHFGSKLQMPDGPYDKKTLKILNQIVKEYTDTAEEMESLPTRLSGQERTEDFKTWLEEDGIESDLVDKLREHLSRIGKAKPANAPANALTNPPAPTPTAAPGEFPLAGETVDGRTVRDSIPNQSSIGASLTDYKVLKGVREIPMSAMDPEYVSSIQKVGLNKRTKALQDAIKESGEINPLIVVQDKDGLYVLEGSHRYDALAHAGARWR